MSTTTNFDPTILADLRRLSRQHSELAERYADAVVAGKARTIHTRALLAKLSSLEAAITTEVADLFDAEAKEGDQ